MTVENASEASRRHRIPMNLVGYHLALKIQQNGASEDILLEDYGVRVYAYKEQ